MSWSATIYKSRRCIALGLNSCFGGILCLPFLSLTGWLCELAFAPELIDEDILDEARPDVDGKDLEFMPDGDGTELELIATEFATSLEADLVE